MTLSPFLTLFGQITFLLLALLATTSLLIASASPSSALGAGPSVGAPVAARHWPLKVPFC